LKDRKEAEELADDKDFDDWHGVSREGKKKHTDDESESNSDENDENGDDD
jgi:hypothetical protein